MIVKLIDDKDCRVVEKFIKDKPNIAKRYQLKKVKEHRYEITYEFSCDKIEDLFKLVRKIQKSTEMSCSPILYSKGVQLFYGWFEG